MFLLFSKPSICLYELLDWYRNKRSINIQLSLSKELRFSYILFYKLLPTSTITKMINK